MKTDQPWHKHRQIKISTFNYLRLNGKKIHLVDFWLDWFPHHPKIDKGHHITQVYFPDWSKNNQSNRPCACKLGWFWAIWETRYWYNTRCMKSAQCFYRISACIIWYRRRTSLIFGHFVKGRLLLWHPICFSVNKIPSKQERIYSSGANCKPVDKGGKIVLTAASSASGLIPLTRLVICKDSLDGQADQSLKWLHMPYCWFVKHWLMSVKSGSDWTKKIYTVTTTSL